MVEIGVPFEEVRLHGLPPPHPRLVAGVVYFSVAGKLNNAVTGLRLSCLENTSV